MQVKYKLYTLCYALILKVIAYKQYSCYTKKEKSFEEEDMEALFIKYGSTFIIIIIWILILLLFSNETKQKKTKRTTKFNE